MKNLILSLSAKKHLTTQKSSTRNCLTISCDRVKIACMHVRFWFSTQNDRITMAEKLVKMLYTYQSESHIQSSAVHLFTTAHLQLAVKKETRRNSYGIYRIGSRIE